MPIIIKATANDTNESLIRKFQKKVLLEGLIPEIRAREFHKKPSELRQEYLAEKRRKIKRGGRLSK